jgi:hypothetical protein
MILPLQPYTIYGYTVAKRYHLALKERAIIPFLRALCLLGGTVHHWFGHLRRNHVYRISSAGRSHNVRTPSGQLGMKAFPAWFKTVTTWTLVGCDTSQPRTPYHHCFCQDDQSLWPADPLSAVQVTGEWSAEALFYRPLPLEWIRASLTCH